MLTGEERRGEDDVPHPALAVDLRIEAAGHEARHTAGQSVQDDSCRVDGAVAVHVEHSQQCHDDDSYCNEGSLESSDSCIRVLSTMSVSDTVLVCLRMNAHLWRE